MESLGRLLIVAGVLIVLVGIVLASGSSIPFLGRLPGDIRVERPGFRLYLPITSSLLVSIALTALLWLFTKIR